MLPNEVAGVLERVCHGGVHQVRSPSSLLFEEDASSVVAFLSGTIPIASDPDSGAFLIASWGGDGARSAVASFLFDDVAPSDPTRGDFVVEALSSGDYLRHRGDAKAHPKRTAPICARGRREPTARHDGLGRTGSSTSVSLWTSHPRSHDTRITYCRVSDEDLLDRILDTVVEEGLARLLAEGRQALGAPPTSRTRQAQGFP